MKNLITEYLIIEQIEKELNYNPGSVNFELEHYVYINYFNLNFSLKFSHFDILECLDYVQNDNYKFLYTLILYNTNLNKYFDFYITSDNAFLENYEILKIKDNLFNFIKNTKENENKEIYYLLEKEYFNNSFKQVEQVKKVRKI